MWYSTDAKEKLRHGDGRKIAVGKTHKVKCEPILCKQGLHASPTVFDALGYAPGEILYRVELSGTVVHGEDKSCATERTYLARVDAEPILRAFARRIALDVAHLWDCPPIVWKFLETGGESKRTAARAATWAAARDATRAATNDAARDAAWAAARDAANDAARTVAWEAARTVARDAAWAAAWEAARTVARDAAWAAARDAKIAEYKALLDKMVIDAL